MPDPDLIQANPVRQGLVSRRVPHLGPQGKVCRGVRALCGCALKVWHPTTGS